MSTIYAPTAADNRSAAVGLAELGLAIFPCAPGKKIPLAGSHGYKDASSDPAVADKRWTAFPAATIALATGVINGRMVLDVDWRNGADENALPANCFKTAVVRTPGVLGDYPNHGMHLYFLCPGPQKSLRELDGIGIKGDGGHVLLPPSRTANGVYEWFNGLEPIELPQGYLSRWKPEVVYAKLSPQLQDLVGRQRQRGPIEVAYPELWAAKGLSNQVDYVLRAPNGNGNNQLNISGFIVAQIVATGYLSEQTAIRDLTNAGLAIGLAPPKVRATLASGMSRGRLFKRQIILVAPQRRRRRSTRA